MSKRQKIESKNQSKRMHPFVMSVRIRCIEYGLYKQIEEKRNVVVV